MSLKDNIDTIGKEADRLEGRASILKYHAKKKRVTHTVAALIRCLLSLKDMVKIVQNERNFLKLLERTLEKAYEEGTGSWEVKPYVNGTVWIKGAFHIDKLRDGLITVPQPNMDMTMERDNG